MNKLSIALAGLIAGIGMTSAAVAHGGSVSTTRAEVRAQTLAAQRAGQIEHGEAARVFSPVTGHSTSRAEVRARTVSALHAGAIEHGEAAGSVVAAGASSISRAAVVAEAREAQRLGLLASGEIGAYAAHP